MALNTAFVDYKGDRQNQNPLAGYLPDELWGAKAPDGDVRPFFNAAVGSSYERIVTPGHFQRWVKVKEDGRDDDWYVENGVIRFYFTKADMTDGGSTAGTYTATGLVIPVGAYVMGINITGVAAFSGDTSAAVNVGDGTDVDRYNKSTAISVFAATGAADVGAPSGTRSHATAVTPVVTVTSGADFTNVAATGAMAVAILYTGGN